MSIKKLKKGQGRYLPLSDIEKINVVYLDEIDNVKTRLTGVDDKELINSFYNVLMNSYNATIDLKTLEREVDYDVKFAKIKERERNIKPWRRGWWWRLLLFFPLTNRAQDIIEERAALEANIEQTAEEQEIENDRKKLPSNDSETKQSKRKLKCKMRDNLKAIIRKADKSDLNEVLNERNTSPEQPESATSEPKATPVPQTQWTRPPRPPRNCRKL